MKIAETFMCRASILRQAQDEIESLVLSPSNHDKLSMRIVLPPASNSPHPELVEG
jgi:hypothetical protein